MHILTGLLVGEILSRTKLFNRRGALPFELVHVLPGRLRVHVAGLSEGGPLATTLERELGSIEGVEGVSVNRAGRSLLVTFVDGQQTRAAIIETLTRVTKPSADHDQTNPTPASSVATKTDGASAAAAVAPSGPAGGHLGEMVMQGIERIDRVLLDKSSGLVDLRSALGALAATFGAKTLLAPGRLTRWHGVTMLYWSYGLLSTRRKPRAPVSPAL